MAAMGLIQFERYPEMLKTRQEYAACYNKGIDALNAELDANHQVAYLNHKGENHCSSHHLYLVRLQGRSREEANKMIEQMAERGIVTNVHYKPLIDIDKRSGSMEVVTPIYVARMLNVPIDQVEPAMRELELI